MTKYKACTTAVVLLTCLFTAHCVDETIDGLCDEKREFQCVKSGVCIPRRDFCDGDRDCNTAEIDDSSDEYRNCELDIRCGQAEYQCDVVDSATGDRLRRYDEHGTLDNDFKACIRQGDLCDTYNDCPFGDDEGYKQCHNHQCRRDELQCDSNRPQTENATTPQRVCWETNRRCNDVVECIDGADEIGCHGNGTGCRPGYFMCGDVNVCLSNYRLCNGIDDCPKKEGETASDESRCTTTTTTESSKQKCNDGQFQCEISGRCIFNKDYLCDGDNDCGEGDTSDEPPFCHVNKTCPYGEYKCSFVDPETGEIVERGEGDPICVDQYQRCDGRKDCRFGDDESYANCAGSYECPQDAFRCDANVPKNESDSVKSRICIYSICDDDLDCIDGADEVNCRAERSVCPNDTFKCDYLPPGVKDNVTLCLENSQVCSGGPTNCPAPPGQPPSDETEAACEAKRCQNDQFQCEQSKRCTPSSYYCDGDFDCRSAKYPNDTSDEPTGCLLNKTCSEGSYQCSRINPETGELQRPPQLCIALDAICSGWENCEFGDGPDKATCEGHKCADDKFKCESYKCISNGYLCDGDKDCRTEKYPNDTSDELPNCWLNKTCREDQFRCGVAVSPETGDLQRPEPLCIPRHSLCNGYNDCESGIDESYSVCKDFQCPEDRFFCRSNVPTSENQTTENRQICLPSHDKCDGYSQCADGEDEVGCHSDGEKCPPDFFKCEGFQGICIPSIKVCDQFENCPRKNGENVSSDESQASCRAKTCPIDRPFKCALTTRCIEEHYVCSKYNQCGYLVGIEDKSDEPANCFENVTCDWTKESRCQLINPETGRVEKPPGSRACVPDIQLCDGVKNCHFGSDESFATCSNRTCGSDQFTCKTTAKANSTRDSWVGPQTRCVALSKLCDGNKDCSDGSDEEPGACNKPKDSPTTLPVVVVGADTDKSQQKYEEINECLQESNNICQQICINADRGYFCSCHDGYKLKEEAEGDHVVCLEEKMACQQTYKGTLCSCEIENGLFKPMSGSECVDIDECSLNNGGCEHLCSNIDGSHSCSCHDGYQLLDNGKSCQKQSKSCEEMNGNCDQECIENESSADGFECRCRNGFVLNPNQRSCDDVDECDQSPCEDGNNCVNTWGSFFCIVASQFLF